MWAIKPTVGTFLSILLGKVAFTKQALFIKTLLNPNSSNSFFNILANSI